MLATPGWTSGAHSSGSGASHVDEHEPVALPYARLEDHARRAKARAAAAGPIAVQCGTTAAAAEVSAAAASAGPRAEVATLATSSDTSNAKHAGTARAVETAANAASSAVGLRTTLATHVHA